MKPTQDVDATLRLAIDGMSCGHCVQAVTRALSTIPGVTVCAVGIGSAEFRTSDKAASHQVIAALESEGFAARVVE